MVKKNKKRNSTKFNKIQQKNKLLPRKTEVIVEYLENGLNVSQTAKQFKVDRNTFYSFLDTPEAKEEMKILGKKMDDDFYLLKQRAKRILINECLKHIRSPNKKMKDKDWAYFLANLTGVTSDVQIAKIQSGSGQGSTESNGGQMTTEDLEHYRKVTKNDKE